MKSAGLSMIEVLTVTAILAILMIMAITMLPRQMEKARDAQRKDDLQKIKIAFEHYYNDNGCYPDNLDILKNCGGVAPANHQLSPYLQDIPCDPLNEGYYLYSPYDNSGGVGTCDGFRVWANLEKNDDPVIESLSCDGAAGCGALDFFEAMGSEASEYNYGVSEGVPVFTGEFDVPFNSGFCCSNSPGDDCNAWNRGYGSCIVGPYELHSECIANTVCE